MQKKDSKLKGARCRDLRMENAVSRQHQQQRFVFNALWDLPIGEEGDKNGKSEESTSWLTQTFSHIEMAPILTLESVRPVNPLTGVDSNQSHAFPPLDQTTRPREFRTFNNRGHNLGTVLSYRRPELKHGTGSSTSVRLENRCCKCLYAKIKAPILLRGRP